jgi:hypothetical protein
MPAPKSKRRVKPVTQSRVAAWISVVRTDWPLTLLLVVGLPLLWLALLQFPVSPPIPNVETSWYAALTHFSAQGLQFGRDIVFTYGPFGYLVSPVFTGELFSAKIIWELVSKTIFVGILAFTLIRLPGFWRLFFFLFVLLFIQADGTADALYFLIISCLAFLLFQDGLSSKTLNIVAAILFGIFSLIKFTYFLLAFVVLILAATCYWKQRKPSQGMLIGLVFITSFLLCWWIAKQDFQNLIAYFSTSFDISIGYKEAMALRANSNAVVLAGLIAALFSLLLCILLLLDSRSPALAFAALFIAAETYLSWNRAFIRADHHVLSFFCLHPIILVGIWIVAQPKDAIRRIGYGINLLVFGICLFGIAAERPERLTRCVPNAMETIGRSWQFVFHLPSFTEQSRKMLAGLQSSNALPKVQAEVRDATLDVFGENQGIAILNHLNYTPRPIFQGYSAYTPSLIYLNTVFYSSAKAPAYVLSQNQTIDGRYPTLDDAGVLKQLLYNYKPLFAEKGYLLWKRIKPASPIQPATVANEVLTFDSDHVIPANEIVWLELDIKKSLVGRLLGFLYRSPGVTISVTDSLGRQYSNRLIPSMASAGFIISPNLSASWQLLRAASGTVSPSSGGSFSVHISDRARRFFQPTMACRIATLPPVPKSELDEKAAQMSREVVFEKQETSQPWLQQLFDASKETAHRSDPTNGFQGITSLNKVRVAPEQQGLRVFCAGTGPQIQLPTLSKGGNEDVLFRMDLSVPTDTSFEVYSAPGNDPASAVSVFTESLPRGENTIYFFLTEHQLTAGPLVAYTGMSTGDYLIRNVEARVVSPETFQQ